MVQIIVEGKTVEVDLPRPDVKLREIIDEAEGFLVSVGKIPVALSINGRDLTQTDLEKEQEQIMKGDEVLEFGVRSIFVFLIENLDGAAKANKELIETFSNFGKEVHEGDSVTPPEELVEELQQFFHFWMKISFSPFFSILPFSLSSLSVTDRSNSPSRFFCIEKSSASF